MKKEKSCGAIIYKYENNELYILLLKHNQGHWAFAKGHIEENETEEETAIREIKEETNLEVKIDTNFRYITTYSPKENTIKDVVYFIATPKSTNIKEQIEEISQIKWFKKEDSLNQVTYNDDKEVLKNAIKYIENKYNKKKNS